MTLMKLLPFLFLVTLFVPVAYSEDTVHTTDWVDSDGMGASLRVMNENGLFPCHITGRAEEFEISYKADYCRFLSGMGRFYSRWGMTQDQYTEYTGYYKNNRMNEHFRSTFVDGAGNTRYQATWISTTKNSAEDPGSSTDMLREVVRNLEAQSDIVIIEKPRGFVGTLRIVLDEFLNGLEALIDDISYWWDGVRIDWYASPEYRADAMALMAADSEARARYAGNSHELYEQREFPALEDVVREAQEAYEKGATLLLVWDEIDVFAADEPGKQALLDEWVSSAPDDWVPYAARAEYLVAKGWRARGTKFLSETPREQLRDMRQAFDAAEEDILKTIELKPGYLRSYYNYLQMAITGESSISESGALALALAQNSGASHIRSAYMHSLTPNWGGSYQQMRRFAWESQSEREADPRVYLLLGREYEARAKAAKRAKDYTLCAEEYNRAFKYGERVRWRYDSARCNEYAENWDAMIENLEAVAEARADDDAFYRMSKAHAAHQRYAQAIDNVERAIELNSGQIAYTNYAGWLYQVTKDDDKALKTYSKTHLILPNDVYAAEQMMHIYLSRGEREAALPNLEIALKHDSENFKTWYLYADVLHHLDRPGHREALERYLGLVDHDNSKNRKRITMVESYLAGEGEFE